MADYFKIIIGSTMIEREYHDVCDDGFRRDYHDSMWFRYSATIKIIGCEMVRDFLKDAKDLDAGVTALKRSIPGCIIETAMPSSVDYCLRDVEVKETVLDGYEVEAKECDLDDGEYLVLAHGGIKGWYTEDYVPSMVHSAIRDRGGKAGIDVKITVPKGEYGYKVASEEARAIVEQYMSESGLTMDNRYTMVDFED